ncbi:Uncharacterised protein [Mycolicibacterium fortuitum]|uniref:Uncharacterized protein n=1 Tax=Mycolicibacterium fortuitum TaxID=1766 RepID=A0A378UWD3_MYCFO|nr:Uncharacterised protein [Mycolicibacterium fortuitum]
MGHVVQSRGGGSEPRRRQGRDHRRSRDRQERGVVRRLRTLRQWARRPVCHRGRRRHQHRRPGRHRQVHPARDRPQRRCRRLGRQCATDRAGCVQRDARRCRIYLGDSIVGGPQRRRGGRRQGGSRTHRPAARRRCGGVCNRCERRRTATPLGRPPVGTTVGFRRDRPGGRLRSVRARCDPDAGERRKHRGQIDLRCGQQPAGDSRCRAGTRPPWHHLGARLRRQRRWSHPSQR